MAQVGTLSKLGLRDSMGPLRYIRHTSGPESASIPDRTPSPTPQSSPSLTGARGTRNSTLTFDTEEAYQGAVAYFRTRQSTPHQNLVPLHLEKSTPETRCVTVSTEPWGTGDLTATPLPQTTEFRAQYLIQTLRALAFLEASGQHHGDVRPEHVLFEASPLAFRLRDAPHVFTVATQAENLRQNRPLYLPYAVYLSVKEGEATSFANPFKQDVFAVGLIFLGLLGGPEAPQRLYTQGPTGLDALVAEVTSKVAGNRIQSALVRFVATNLLAAAPSKRLSPRKAEAELSALLTHLAHTEMQALPPLPAGDPEDVGWVQQLPNPAPQALVSSDADGGAEAPQDIDTVLPLNRAFPKNEIDFAKTTKAFRPVKKDGAGKPVPRWEVMFVNADMTYRTVGRSGVGSVSQEPVGPSQMVHPPLEVNRLVTRSFVDSSPKPRGVKAEPIKSTKIASRKTIQTQTLVPSTTLPLTQATSEMKTLSRRNIKFARVPAPEAKASGRFIDVSFRKVEADTRVTTDLGKGIPLGNKRLEFLATTPNGKQVFRYAP